MNHATGLLEGTEEANQATFHTWAATIKKEKHVPIIDIRDHIEAATGHLQEVAQYARISLRANDTGAASQTPKTLR
ncbi:MAG: hypothetical protein ACKPGB_22090, partial [Dolichospermum sp.]